MAQGTARSERQGIAFCLALALAAAGGPAPAQTPDSGLPTRQEVEPPRPSEEGTPRRVRIDRSAAIETAPCPLEDSPLTVRLDRIRFAGPGGEALSPELAEALAPIRAPGGTQPLSLVCRLRDEANARLRRQGYIASVQIPPQRIETGELQLSVVTGRIVEVRLRGDAPPYREAITRRAEQLKALRPLNERDAERILLLAGDIPGLDVQLTLLPAGAEPGDLIGLITVDYAPFRLLANANNWGSRQLGRETLYARGELYGLTRAEDLTYVGASTTLDFEEQRVVQAGHAFGIGGGAALSGDFLYAWSRPDLDGLALRSTTMVAGLGVDFPLVRTRRQTLRIGGGLELIEQRTRVRLGGAGLPLTRDKLRVAFLRAEGQLREPSLSGGDHWLLTGRLELRQGLDMFDATERGEISPSGYTPSRIEGDPSAFVLRGEATGIAALSDAISLAGQVQAQWASSPLLNFEEYSVGNFTIGRGYDPGSNSADRAIGLRAELRGRVFQNARSRVELFAFVDSAWIWNLDAFSTENGRRLLSWGGGVRGWLGRTVYLEAVYARPEDRVLALPGAVTPSDRLLLSLTVQFAPVAR